MIQKCEFCGRFEPVFSRPKGSNKVVCLRCLVKVTKQCKRCGEHVLISDLVRDQSGEYCKGCMQLMMEGKG